MTNAPRMLSLPAARPGAIDWRADESVGAGVVECADAYTGLR